jgi:hypothetical protein
MKPTSGKALQSPLWLALVLVGLALLFAVVGLVFNEPHKGPLAEVAVDDGRIIVVEAITYGTNHAVGNASLLVDRLGPWMPKRLRDFLSPKVPRTSITTGPDTLVVWLNALDANSRTNVDCQGLLVEFEDEAGDLWGKEMSNWHAFPDHNRFIRIGHSFAVYPRSAEELTLRITPLRSTNTVTVTVRNPRVTQPAKWTGQPAPQRRLTNGLEIVLEELSARTNGAPDEPWVTRSRYWEPSWKLLSDGAEIHGWRPPEWIAADPLGNHGQFLGLHQPVLRYSVTFHPEVTNELATEIVASLPTVSLAAGATNTLWFRTNSLQGIEVAVIGLMTTPMNFFTEGVYEPAPPPLGITQGGAPTGWVSSGRRLSPVKHVMYRGHYADRPVIYLQCRDAALAGNLGVRLRDDQDRLWPTTRESQGNPDGLLPFMLDVPPGITSVTPEIVWLNAVGAEFTVRTPVGTTP